MQVITMKCPGCGADLQIAPHMENFTCGYCGTSLRAIRQGGTVSLIADAIAKVQSGTDRTAAELALVRLERELIDIRQRIASSTPVRPGVPVEPTYAQTSSLWFQNFFSVERQRELDVRNSNKIAKENYSKQKQQYSDRIKSWQDDMKKAAPFVKVLEQQEGAILDQIDANERIVRRPIG